MKNLGNTFRIIGIVSASLLLIGTGAHAAAKQGAKQMKAKAVKVTKVEGVTLNHLPFRASGPSGNDGPLRSNNPGNPHDLTPTVPDNPRERGCFAEYIGQGDPAKFNGYFMKRYALLKNMQNSDGPKGISPQIDEIPISPADPTFKAFQYFEMLEIISASDKIDSKYLLGPDRAPPDPFKHGWEAFNRWVNRENYYNISNNYDRWDAGTNRKVANWGTEDGTPNGTNGPHPLIQESGDDKDGGEKDPGSSDSGGTDDSGKTKPDTTAGKPVDDETGSQPDADKDDNPEGDDPDEFRTPTSETATRSAAESASPVIAARHQDAAGSSGSGRSGSGNQGSMPQGGGLPNDPENNPSNRVPEGGRPDEMGTPVASGALNSAVIAGHNLQPEPGGDDPDDPRASEGSVRAVGTTLGYAASPPDGGQSGETGPTDPRF